jgi:hypothetical protein
MFGYLAPFLGANTAIHYQLFDSHHLTLFNLSYLTLKKN